MGQCLEKNWMKKKCRGLVDTRSKGGADGVSCWGCTVVWWDWPCHHCSGAGCGPGAAVLLFPSSNTALSRDTSFPLFMWHAQNLPSLIHFHFFPPSLSFSLFPFFLPKYCSYFRWKEAFEKTWTVIKSILSHRRCMWLSTLFASTGLSFEKGVGCSLFPGAVQFSDGSQVVMWGL